MRRASLDLLLVDVTTRGADPAFEQLLEAYFNVRRAGHAAVRSGGLASGTPALLCMEFDHPDAGGLALLVETKRRYPSMPIVMATLQHSADLALWALRARVWDYLPKPVAEADVASLAERLALLKRSRERDAKSRVMVSGSNDMPQEVQLRGRSPARSAVLPAVSYVENNLDKKIRESVVAALCRMSPFRFSRAFKEAHGVTFQEYVTRLRLREAVRLLGSPHASIAEVSYRVGFSDPSYFSKVFRRYVGLSPSEYRLREDEAAGADEIDESLLLAPA